MARFGRAPGLATSEVRGKSFRFSASPDLPPESSRDNALDLNREKYELHQMRKLHEDRMPPVMSLEVDGCRNRLRSRAVFFRVFGVFRGDV